MNNSSAPNASAPNNGSFPFQSPIPFFTQFGWIFGVLTTHTILGVFTTFSNLLVLLAFYKNSKLRSTTNLVIISMATADLLVGAVVIPFWLYTADLQFMIGPPFEKWQITMFQSYLYIDQALGLNSTYQLVLLHSLRSYSIVFPLKHRQLSNRPVILACLLVWAICIAFPPLVREVFIPESCGNCFVYVTLVANIGLPLVLLTAANIMLWRSVAKSSRQHQKKDTKILVTVAILIGILCVCFLPFLLANVIARVNRIPVSPKVIIPLKLLHFFNSAINPPIYALRHPEIARTFKAIFCPRTARDVTASTRTRATNNATTSRAVSIS